MSATADDHYRYWAFVSYSSKDSGVARKLHRRLETYRIPRDLVGRPGRDEPVPRRLFPIFRDRDELPLSADLGASIEDALAASRYLIVLCSRHSARSRWVNEEVRHFKSLGREDRILAIILDGEPNASEVPGAEDQECFPPALRFRVDSDGQLTDERTEPIAGDLRPQGDGWSGAFLKAVAGITGLGFDAFARRERKRQRRRRLAGGAVGLVLIALGLGAWDYNRVQVEHYANVGTRWGVPEGVGPLDARTRAGREFHYRFESRRRKVRQVQRMNSAGELRNDGNNHDGSVQQIFYREDGTVQQIDLRDHNGRLVLRQTFSELRETPEGEVHYVEFRHEHRDAPLALAATAGALGPAGEFDRSRRSEITAHEVLYDDHGRWARARYLNAHRQNRPNADGVFAQEYMYQGSGGLPVRTENLGFDGDPLPNRGGVVFLTAERSALGDVTKAAYFGAGGESVLNRSGYHTMTQDLDGRGNVTERAFFNVEGEPALHRAGHHTVTQALDERGNVTHRAFFGVVGDPVLHPDGFHLVTWDRDGRGNMTEEAFFGVEGEPALHRNGYHRVTQAWDERGQMTDQAFFGVDGEPVLHVMGAHRLVPKWDDRGNLLELAAFGTDDGPVLLAHGVHRAVQVYDSRDQMVEQRYFGIDGEPVPRQDHYHKLTQTFDERGNVTEQALFGVDGEPVLHLEGYHRLTRTLDDRGGLVEGAYFGVEGEPVLYRDGYHRLTQAFDERGNTTSQAYFGVDGEPALHRDGVHRAVWAHDERGNRVEAAYFGVDGEPALLDGHHRFRGTYDERGNLIEEAYFGAAGAPALHSAGYHRLTQTYDERGNVIELAYFGVADQPVAVSGFVRLEVQYDALGEITSVVGYRADGTSERLR